MRNKLIALIIATLTACGVDKPDDGEKTCKEIGCNFYDCTDFQDTNECACDLFVDGKPEQVMCLHTDEPIL